MLSLKGAREERAVLWLLLSLPCSNTGKTCSPQMDRSAASPMSPATATQLWSPARASWCPACREGYWHKHDKSCFLCVMKLEEQHAAMPFSSFLSGKKECALLGLLVIEQCPYYKGQVLECFRLCSKQRRHGSGARPF